MPNCIFCKIVNGEIAKDFAWQTELVVAFDDINPVASTHILILPKEHFGTFLDIKNTHDKILVEMVSVAQKLIREKKIEDGFKLVFNGGRYQHVPHLHWHLLGGGGV